MSLTDKDVIGASNICLAHAEHPTTCIKHYEHRVRVNYPMEEKEVTNRYPVLPLEPLEETRDTIGVGTKIKTIRIRLSIEEGPTKEVYKYSSPLRERGRPILS